MGPPARSGGWKQGGVMRRGDGAAIPPAAPGTPAPQAEGGLWHTHWHPGFQGPGKGAMSLPAHRGKGERRVGSKRPVRGSARVVRQAGPQGRHGGARVQGTARSPAAGFSCPCRFHPDAQGLRGGNGSEIPPYPLPSSQGSSSGPARGGRWRGWCPGQVHLGGTWEAGSGRSCGQQGCKGSGAGLSPHPSVLRGPRRPHPARSCTQCDLSSFGPKQGGHGSEDALSPALPSSWLLKAQAPVAWVLLELDLLQGEDGGSVFELVHTLSQRPEVWVVQGCLC